MTFRDLLRDTIATLLAHKRRTLLTMFGIAWGIISITLMVAAGEGLGRVSRHSDDAGLAEYYGHLCGEPGRSCAPGGIGLEQTDLVERSRPARQDRADECRHPHAAATEHRQLHRTAPL